MAFSAIHLHDVVSYARWNPKPEVPDWKNLQKKLGAAQDEIKNEDYERASDTISDIKSDYDFGDELETYIDRADDKISQLHGILRDANQHARQWDDCVTREEMMTFMEELQELLSQGLPEDKYLKDMATANWFHYRVPDLIKNYEMLRNLRMNYELNDTYSNKIGFPEEGDCKITINNGGVLRFDLLWRSGGMIFTHDEKIHTWADTDSSGFNMKMSEFVKFFDNWWCPTEDEIRMFKVFYPNADFTVIRYLQEYQDWISRQERIASAKNLMALDTNL